jgi:glycosyltransferase involved in cell wall biosynthesis
VSDVTVVITTKDRRDDLREAIAGCLAQTADLDVLVIDDGSSDGTSEMVRSEFPDVRLHRSDESRGLIFQRTAAASMTDAPVIVSIDDDARLVSPHTVEQTIADFDHPRIGAVAIPYVDVLRGGARRQLPPDQTGRWITDTYIGTAHAVRRELFLRVGGYRTSFVHMGEEPELCVRLLAAGHVVRLGRADALDHLETHRGRMLARNVRLVVRNQLVDAWLNAPTRRLPGRVGRILARSAADSVRWRQPAAAAGGAWEALRAAARGSDERAPVPDEIWKLLVDLRRRGPLRLEDVEPRIAPFARVEAVDTLPRS